MSAIHPRGAQDTSASQDRVKRQRVSNLQAGKTTEATLLSEREESAPGSTAPATSAKAKGTLYDAVAGRLDDQGFILDGRRQPVAPDAVLFRRQNAPPRYEEDDPYSAHRDLPPDVKLPDSDLLKAIHAYCSDFYGSGVLGDCGLDYQSLDETALIALGILLEETARISAPH